MTAALEQITKTYRWGIVSTNEPAGVRSVRGFVTVLEFCLPSGAPTSYQVVFFDTDGRPLDRFEVDTFRLFACAAGLALEELGLHAPKSSLDHVAALIVLA